MCCTALHDKILQHDVLHVLTHNKLKNILTLHCHLFPISVINTREHITLLVEQLSHKIHVVLVSPDYESLRFDQLVFLNNARLATSHNSVSVPETVI